MTVRADIIRMAREQGLPETKRQGVFIVNTDDLGRMLAAEREACVKAVEDISVYDEFDPFEAAVTAIRARGTP